MITRLLFAALMPVPSTILLMRTNRKLRREFEIKLKMHMRYANYLVDIIDRADVEPTEFDLIAISALFQDHLEEGP